VASKIEIIYTALIDTLFTANGRKYQYNGCPQVSLLNTRERTKLNLEAFH